MFPAVQAWLGRDPRGRTTADLDAALTALTVVRPWVHVEDGRKYRGDLVKGTVCVAQGKIGDLLAVRDRALHGKGPHPDIAVILPKEGGLLGLDVMAIPADAPNPGAAEALMNFLLRPGIIAEVTSEVGRANVVPASLPLIDPAVRSDPLIYPPSDIQDKLFLLASSASREFDRLRTRAWARFRAARH